MDSPLPAHCSKHRPLLRHPFRRLLFHLAQRDDGASNGTALWLGAQCLSLYLADNVSPPRRTARPRAIELGSGIGLSALALSAMGWDVVATDLPEVISSVLAGNVARNASHLPSDSGLIQVRALDWTVAPDEWVWTNTRFIASPLQGQFEDTGTTLEPPFDLIISADTLYSTDIVQPLLRALHSLARLSTIRAPAARPPQVYLCIERRDPALIDHALRDAHDVWNFMVERVPHKKVAKAMERGGAKWKKEDWEGIEIWKLTYGGTLDTDPRANYIPSTAADHEP
ncbi:uncharacterized protein FIBRA_04440 [Fibroporia radiculosa]|uniref:Uncharacterized protein n=1 Tax=Fibroporia radiculosa TaxID=599839 RepID=J4GP91_9APHY|nr:uncharacterized protein FIBRA_04440 [Fibroporia radiculosa]CCM02345.1 predicted protein [Fibroporia radiculosa]